MRQKEKLIREYFILKHKFDMNEPGCKKITTPEPSIDDIYDMSHEYSIINLKDKINAVKSALKNQEKRINIEKYFLTEEGKKFKEENETKRNELENIFNSVSKSYAEKVENIINKFLGGNFISTFYFVYNSCRGEIGIKNNEKDRPGFKFKFGHSFNVSYDNHFGKDYKFEMNYGTLGSFDIINDNDRAEYLLGMGKFVSSKSLHDILLNIMIEGIDKLKSLNNELDNIDNKLKNPF